MAESDFKPDGKCPYSRYCSLYSANLLKEEFEKEMCGKGQEVDESYVPHIPQHDEITPVKDWTVWPEGRCLAFDGQVYHNFYVNLVSLVKDLERAKKGEPPILKI